MLCLVYISSLHASLQVIGRVGFGKSFGSLESLDHPAEGDAFKMVAIGALLTSEVAAQQHNRSALLLIWRDHLPDTATHNGRPCNSGTIYTAA